jgi:flagellar basal body-associated protein FliL
MGARVLIPFLVLSNTAVVGGLVTVLRDESAPASAQSTPAPTDGEDNPETHFPLQFVVRVRSGDSDRYVRTGYELLLVQAEDRELLLANLPKIRDAVLGYYLDRTLEDLTGSAGIERSKRAVVERVQRITRRPVRAIYLTDFVVM